MTKEKIEKQFLRVWPVKLAVLTRFLIDCRSYFDGDLDSLLIMSVIVDRMIKQQNLAGKLSIDEFLAMGWEIDPSFRAVNAHAIAQFTGIPRENVRRKIEGLVAKGWVHKHENGLLTATCKAKADLLPIIRLSVDFVAQIDFALHKSD